MQLQKLLNKSSLSSTVDKINEIYFVKKSFSEYNVDETVKWILSRYDTKYSYNKSFGLTEQDMNSKLRTFTGEVLNSPASNRHIHAEEASRALNILKKYTSLKMPELEKSESDFLKIFKANEKAGKPEGTFCCGPCTVSLWRNMSAGGLGAYSKKLNKGYSVLQTFRKGNGEWSRFPFYYTLSVLYETFKLPNAGKEIEYAYDQCIKKIKRLKGNDKYAERKHELLKRIIEL